MSTLWAKPIERVPLNQHVVDAIIKGIRTNELHLGDKLPAESKLCEQFGVGRHVIREALRRLEEMSIVRTETGKGTFICSTAPDSLGPQASSLLLLGNVNGETLLDFRLAIETHSSYFAAARASEADCENLREILERMNKTKDDPKDGDLFLQANFEFHNTVVKLSGNQMFIVLYNTMNDLLSQLVITYPYSSDSTHSSYEEHRGIYEAIVKRDKAEAFRLAYEHLMRLRIAQYGAI